MTASDERVSIKERLCYGAGNMGINLQFGMVNAFVVYFYTDMYGIAPATVAIVFLLARLLDAAFDPFLGVMIDKTNTRFGKHRPYLGALAVPFALCSVGLFVAPPLEGSWKLIYVFVTYTLFGFLYSGLSLPLISMLPTLTRDNNERYIVNSVREFMASGAALGVGFITMPLVGLFGGGSELRGFWRTVVLFGIISVVGIALLVLNTRERVPPIKENTLSTAQSLRAAVGNWPWFSTLLINFLFWVGLTLHIQSTIYFAKDVLKNVDYQPMLMLATLTAPPGTIAVGWISNRFGKRRTAFLGGLLAAVATVGNFWSNSIVWLFVCNSITFLGIGLLGGLLIAMMADAVEFGEWRSGYRAQGFLFAASSFGVKLGMSLGGAVGAWLLAYAGYTVSGPVTPAVVRAMQWGYTWGPALCLAGAAASALFFNFDPKIHSVRAEPAAAR